MSSCFTRIAIDGHTLGSKVGGNESYVRGLLQGLHDCGFDGEVVLYVPEGYGASPPGPKLTTHEPLRSAGGIRRLTVEFPAALAHARPDFAHFQYIGPPRSPCPTTLAIHDTSFVQAPELLPRGTALRLRHTTGMAIRRCAAVVVPSAWTAETLCARYPDAVGKTHVVPLAPLLPAIAEGGEFDHRLPERFCLYVGRRQRRKNLDFLLRAYAEARTRAAELPSLLLLGPPAPDDAALRALADELGVGERVIMRGYAQPEMLAAAYRRADFFCYPCRYEGFGLPLAEAMASDCAALAADEGGLPETVSDAAMLLPPDSVSAWAEAMARLCHDADARGDLARRGHERATQMTWARTATGLLDAARAAGLGRS